MNKASIKTYAIWARNELISRVSQKAYEYGIEKDNIVSSDADSINGRLFSSDEKNKRRVLISQVNQKGYDQVIEEAAYTWFNRFIALRFMEVNNYLPNKVRLFTNEDNEFKPQILEEALHIDLLGLDKNKVIALKESNNNEDLYKELLLATCNDMSQFLPGMFKPISDYMTLLFPSNLLREESVLGRLISDIDEDSWSDQVQIIGWLYQYYNTELNEIVYDGTLSRTRIPKELLPAATTIYTPDWPIRYMIENSLGRLWLNGHPNVDIKENWKFYLDEAEQEEAVQIELNKIKAEHAKLKPEDIKFFDPCMGSGHILVYAFDVFMQIYVSEGWTEREATISILQKNIYGLDIDERAYQLSYFALMMKARQYNRRILTEGIVPNVMAIEESNTFNKDLLRRFRDLKPLAERIVNRFIDAKEYGSILNVEFTKEELNSLEDKLIEINGMSDYGNLLDQLESKQVYYDFLPLLKQARVMSQKYECVVTNPPYLGSNRFSQLLDSYVKANFLEAKSDLSIIMFQKAVNSYANIYGYISFITTSSWMFLSSFQNFRSSHLSSNTLVSIVDFGTELFDGKVGHNPIVSWISYNKAIKNYRLKAVRLVDYCYARRDEKEKQFFKKQNVYVTNISDFSKVPGRPIAYWPKKCFFDIFDRAESLSTVAYSFQGMITGDNNYYLRLWCEPNFKKVKTDIRNETRGEFNDVWVPYNKGGENRKWFGNNSYVLRWINQGKTLTRSRSENSEYYFREGVTWSFVTSGKFSCRFFPSGALWDVAGSSIFGIKISSKYIAALLNSKVAQLFFDITNPTINYQVMNILAVPYIKNCKENNVIMLSDSNIAISKKDWDSFEVSWEFTRHPLIRGFNTIMHSYNAWEVECTDRFNQLKANEEELNRIFIASYGLQDELTPEVEDKDITVRKADLQREVKSLISYAVGCMFGRYSLDVNGLAYAGGEWDDSKYKTFIPDKDDIIPICDDEYFEDDIVGRFIEFIKAAYGEDTLEKNLQFIADVLGGKETSREVIRNYFLNDFFKDHCDTYQVTGSGKRPIYWQFDSGKKNGFKALVYIHRYTPDLIARMRTSYVHEQQSRYENQISMIQNRIDTAGSTSERVKAEKELKKLKEQAEELRIYEEKIHHWADKMEPMDLDDGVKANYAKFQELLTRIK